MNADEPVCLCFQITLGKITHYLNRERPAHPSQISQCLGAGTGCGGCIPLLEKLHQQAQQGSSEPTNRMAGQECRHQSQTNLTSTKKDT